MNYSPKLSASSEETLVQNEKKVNELQKTTINPFVSSEEQINE